MASTLARWFGRPAAPCGALLPPAPHQQQGAGQQLGHTVHPMPTCRPILCPTCTLLPHIPLLQEASFKEFLARPENQALVEQQQRKEVKQAVQLQDKMRALEFRDKVGAGRFGRLVDWVSALHLMCGCWVLGAGSCCWGLGWYVHEAAVGTGACVKRCHPHQAGIGW